MICNDQVCNCALVSETLSVNGSGTPGDPWVIEQTEFTAITDIQNDIANIEAELASLPDEYVNTSGDTMTGTLVVNGPGASLDCRRAGDTPFIQLMNQDGVRTGYLQGIGTTSPKVLRLLAEAGNDLQFHANATHRMTIQGATGSLLYGKTAPSTAVAGFEVGLGASATSMVTRSTAAGVCFFSNRIGAADVNAAQHFTVASAGTTIGSITRATASTTAFNTSSDEDLKTNIVEIDDELALWVARAIQPYLFEFANTPGDVHPGYIAQRVAAMWPESIALGIVRPGHGDINDRTWDSDGNETTPTEVWEQWQMDYSKMVPVIHAAWQAVDRRQQLHEQAIAALSERHEHDVDTLVVRIEALESAAGLQ